MCISINCCRRSASRRSHRSFCNSWIICKRGFWGWVGWVSDLTSRFLLSFCLSHAKSLRTVHPDLLPTPVFKSLVVVKRLRYLAPFPTEKSPYSAGCIKPTPKEISTEAWFPDNKLVNYNSSYTPNLFVFGGGSVKHKVWRKEASVLCLTPYTLLSKATPPITSRRASTTTHNL